MTSHHFSESFPTRPGARPSSSLREGDAAAGRSAGVRGVVPQYAAPAATAGGASPERGGTEGPERLKRVRLVLGCAELLAGRGNYAAAEQLFRLARGIDPGPATAVPHAAFLVDRGALHGAECLLRPLLDSARRTPDWELYASVTYLLGRIHLMRGQTAAARSWLQQSIAGDLRAERERLERAGGREAEWAVAADDHELQRKAAELSLAAECALQCGQRRDAGAFARAAVAIERRRGDDACEAVDWSILARVALSEGDLDAALRDIGRALRRQQRSGEPTGKADSLCVLAAVVVAAGRLLTAERVLRRAARAYQEAGLPGQAIGVEAVRRRLRSWIAWRQHDPACN